MPEQRALFVKRGLVESELTKKQGRVYIPSVSVSLFGHPSPNFTIFPMGEERKRDAVIKQFQPNTRTRC